MNNTTEKSLELIVPVTDSKGNEVEIHIMNLEAGEVVKGMSSLCFAFMELRYTNDHLQAYGNPCFYDRHLTELEIKEIAELVKNDIDKYRF